MPNSGPTTTATVFSGFYYIPVDKTVRIPINQQSIVYDEIDIDGTLDVEGMFFLMES